MIQSELDTLASRFQGVIGPQTYTTTKARACQQGECMTKITEGFLQPTTEGLHAGVEPAYIILFFNFQPTQAPTFTHTTLR